MVRWPLKEICVCLAAAIALTGTTDVHAQSRPAALREGPVEGADNTEALRQALEETKAQLAALQAQVNALETALAETNTPAASPGAAQKPTLRSGPDAYAGREAAPARPAASASDEAVIELAERVDELEEVAVDLDERVGSRAVVHAFDGVSLDIGGFFDTAATVAFGEEGTDASFNRQVFELLAKARLGQNWELFVAQAFVRNAPLTFSDPQGRTTPVFANNNSPVVTDTVIAWGQYHHSDALNVQFGRFITPHGIVNIEHFPATLLDTEQPQFLRPFPGQTVFQNFTNGLNIHGQKFLGNSRLNYAVYGGVWAGNSTNGVFGGRLGYSLADTGLTIGLNALSGDRSSEVTGDRFNGGGVDILFDKGPILWKNEVFWTSEGQGDDRLAFYSQPAFRLNDQWTAFYRYDFLDTGGPGARTIEHSAGLVFDPISNVRLRALYRHRRAQEDIGFDAAETDIIQFATTFNF